MRVEHQFDPEYRFVSPALKKAIQKIGDCKELSCLDMPVGNGRNVFYLANHFKNITAVDLNNKFINNIHTDSLKYNLKAGVIKTSILNLEKELPIETASCDFIATIHYFDYSFLSLVIDQMKKGAYFFIETPNCNGGNFFKLPTEQEINNLFKNVAVVFIDKHSCKSNNSPIKNISFKCLLNK
ncbi:methyltransferase domain-containing protein [Arachidicoccus sp.]|uniref:methyltransferase domain-containing protein n=1 Tax=Arachidicoccus sp. TaxID=1872624 RepID=UPI003D23B8FE